LGASTLVALAVLSVWHKLIAGRAISDLGVKWAQGNSAPYSAWAIGNTQVT